MLIQDLQLTNREGGLRLEAGLHHEDSDREPFSLFVEVGESSGRGFWEDPNGFLLAALFPAWNRGEKRVRLEGAPCPVLLGNLKAACDTLQHWYPELGDPPVVESTSAPRALNPVGNEAAAFLSCGIDSLATVRANKLAVPEDHPLSIKIGIAIDYERPHGITEKEERNRAAHRRTAAEQVCRDAGMTPLVVKTNILRLSDGYFFDYKWHGAAMSAVAYCVSRRCHKVYIASSYTIPQLRPWGSHPLLDPYYSSAHLSVEHHGIEMTRMEKTALVAQWPVGLNQLQVCTGQDSGEANCGACEKCIRTMTSLVALGKLKDCRAFPVDDVTPELLATLEAYDMIYADNQMNYYLDIVPYLKHRGRDDLVQVIEDVAAAFHAKPPAPTST